MFDINELKSGSKEILQIDEDFTFTDDMLKTTSIKRLENIHAKGTISRIENTTYNLDLHITGNMVLSCARSLEDVDNTLNIFINKVISEENLEESEEKPLILQNSLDIFSIVWENIVLEVPLRVIKEDATYITQGEGWSLTDEDNFKSSNSPFSELKVMLEDMEEKRDEN